MFTEGGWRRVLHTAAGLFLGAAAVIVILVIPAVRADPFPRATPDKAVPAFVVSVFVQTFGAGLLALAVGRQGKGGRVALSAAVLLGAVTGLFLLDAADAYQAHGPAMRKAALALWVCVIADWSAALAALASAFARHRGRAPELFL